MSTFLHELVTSERAFAAGDNGPFDLPVNPVSFLLLHVRADCGVAAPDFNQLIGHINNISVTFKGTQMINASGVDLARMLARLWGRMLNIEGFNAVAPSLVSFTLPIPFTRVPYWQKECFPATRRGEFNITINRTAALTNIANPVFSLESVSLLDAQPTQWLKMTTVSRAIVAGDADLELPIGNPLLGALIFSPTAMGNTPVSETVRRMRLLLDNVEYQVSDSAFDIQRSVGVLRGSDANEYAGIGSNERNYAFVDFDPLKDESYMIETDGRASVRFRFVPDVGGTVRVIPVELMRLGGAPTA